MVSDISRQGRHHKHVHVYLPIEVRDRFMANIPQGFTARLYAPQQTDPRQYIDKNEVNITLVVNENEPEPTLRRHKEDIDLFLSNISTIDKRIRILSDSVSKNDQPDLLDDWFIKNEVVLSHPGLDEGLDHLRSKAANVKEIEITDSQLENIENRYNKEKKEFIRTKLKDVKTTRRKDPVSGEKIHTVQVGEL